MWKPSLQAAHALNTTAFSICMSEVEYDDPFTAILTYDARFAQPWARTDVDREIVDVTYADTDGDGQAIPVALSNEGDVYLVRNSGTEWTHIKGAGILSADAIGYGSTYKVLPLGSNLIVIGAGRQLYRWDTSGQWETISAGGAISVGYEAEEFTTLAPLEDGALLVASIQRPGGLAGDFTQDPRYRENMTPNEIVGLINSRSAEASGGPKIARLHTYSNAGLKEHAVLGDLEVSCVERDSRNRLWLAGSESLLMGGNMTGGFKSVQLNDEEVNFLSATWFRNALILASDYALHRFDEHILTPLKPKLNPKINKSVPNPLKVQAVGDVLFYFDYKHGVHRFDGENWEEIAIPPELLEREFKGLPLRR